MILIVLAAMLVLAIAFFQVVQGVFSALIMAILSVLCALAAFNYYEPFAGAINAATDFKGNMTFIYPASLIAIFFISLLVLRIIFDRLITGSVSFGTWTDRIGGGVMGLITGIVLVGVLLVAVQMLPWGGAFLGYKPYSVSLQKAQSFSPFKPDRFVVAMTDTLSGGSMGGGKRFSSVHPDLLLELYANRNRGELPDNAGELPGKCSAFNDDLQVKGVYNFPQGRPPRWLNGLPESPSSGGSRSQAACVIRASVGSQARDADNWYRLPATHFRLVTLGVNKSGQKCYNFHYPVAFLTYLGTPPASENKWKAISLFDEKGSQPGLAAVAQLVVERSGAADASGLNIDWVYRIPAGEEPFMLVFRNVSKVPSDSAANLRLPATAAFPENESKFQDGALRRNQGG